MKNPIIFIILPLLAGTLSFASSFTNPLPVEPQYAPFLWSFDNTGQPWRMDEKVGEPGKKGADIHLLEAWKIISEAPDVLVAVIDGGFDTKHPDLIDEFDLTDAYDFLHGSKTIDPPSENWEVHGNLVSGVIGADGENKIGITGISRKSRILPIEAIPSEGSETDENVASAIRYAVDHGSRVINCSFGKYSTSDIVRSAIEYAQEKNVFIVAGAGNDHKSIDKTPFWPASYSAQFTNVIAVTATDRDDELWDSGNYGSTVDLAAPGSEIFSTGASFGDPLYRYFSVSGTSLSAPHVTGVVALMLELDPDLKVDVIKSILKNSSDPLPTLKGKIGSGGRLNAFKALQMTAALKNGCDFDSSKLILGKTKSGYTAEWTIPESAASDLSNSSDTDLYTKYASWVRSKTTLSGVGLLENNMKAWQSALNDPTLDLSTRAYLKKGIRDIQTIIAGGAGKIRPIQCLEKIPFEEFLKVNDLTQHAQEFEAYILHKDGELKIVGDFYHSADDEGADGVSPSDLLNSEKSKLAQQGWALFAHLHNHPFEFDNPSGDLGGNLVPGDEDVQTYRDFDPELALITNGIDTIEMTRTDVRGL